MPTDLQWDVIKAPVGVMCRCPNTFVHIVYFLWGLFCLTATCMYPFFVMWLVLKCLKFVSETEVNSEVDAYASIYSHSRYRPSHLIVLSSPALLEEHPRRLLMKLLERMPRGCKAVSIQRASTKESQIEYQFDLFS